MSRELWLDLAKKACHPHEKSIFASPWGEEWVLRFAESVAEVEREECAKVAEQAGIDGMGTLAAAAMIRKRGEK